MSKIISEEEYYTVISETKSYLFGSEEGRDFVNSIIENLDEDFGYVSNKENFLISRNDLETFFPDILTPAMVRSVNGKTMELTITVAGPTISTNLVVSLERLTFPIDEKPRRTDSIIRYNVDEVASDAERFLRNFIGRFVFVAGPTIDRNGKIFVEDILVDENLDSLSRILAEKGLASLDNVPDNIGWKNYQNVCEFRLMTNSNNNLS